MDIFLVSNNHKKWDAFNLEMTNSAIQINKMDSLENVHEHLKKHAPTLVILDLGLEGKAMRDAVISLIMINAIVHSAVVSSMNEEDFHEYTEGLGIIAPLPENPSSDDAKYIMTLLQELND